jgi:predicted Zn-dependent protease
LLALSKGVNTQNPSEVILAAIKKAEPELLQELHGALSPTGNATETKAIATLISRTIAKLKASLSPEIVSQDALSWLKSGAEVKNKPTLVGYLQSIADRLSKASGIESPKVHLVDTGRVMAQNLGLHDLQIDQALLATLKNEAEVAGVMAHEMTHGLEGHGVDFRFIAAENGPLVSSVFNSGDQVINVEHMNHINEAVTQVARSTETAADAGAARMLAKAGYDPGAVASALSRSENLEAADMFHPSAKQRIADVKRVISNERLDHGAKNLGAERFKKAITVLRVER